MTRPVQWSRAALDDIKAQIVCIARDDPAMARRIAARLSRTGDALGDALTGRPGRLAGTYEKSVSGLPYVMAYSVSLRGGRETVSILRVIHTARDWPADRWPR